MKLIVCALLFSATLSAQPFRTFVRLLEQQPVERRQAVVERYLNSQKTSPIIEQDTLAHVVLYGKADSVFLIGTLQRWKDPVRMEQLPCGQYSLFYTTVIAPPDARLDYQLIIDGNYKTDPQNPRITPSGYGPHSEIRMPLFAESPYRTYNPQVPRGRIDSFASSIHIPPPLNKFLPAARTIKVYLPPGYDTLSRLSTVYVHDGDDAINFAELPVIIDNLIAAEQISPIIAVFIPPVERSKEYAGESIDQFVKFLADLLVPHIDQRYKTERSSLRRGMMGISNGGHISLYTVFNRPDVFQMAAGQSSTITPLLRTVTQRQAENNAISPLMRIYLDCGRYDIRDVHPTYGPIDFLELNKSYSDLLVSLRIPHYYKEFNDGHEWANWRERMPDILTYFFGTHR